MARICSICVRGGSKGVLGKNHKLLMGKPLIAHSILQALETGLFDEISVSSDSDLLLEISENYGVKNLIKRPLDMANDTAPKLPAIRHCVRETEKITGKSFATCVDLDATSPLRNLSDVVNVVRLLEESTAGNILTAMPARRSPYFNLLELSEDGAPVLSKPPKTAVDRRQDSPQCFDMNGSIYAWTYQSLMESEGLFNFDSRLYVMPEERSIDIDTDIDFEFVEFIMSKRLKNQI